MNKVYLYSNDYDQNDYEDNNNIHQNLKSKYSNYCINNILENLDKLEYENNNK